MGTNYYVVKNLCDSCGRYEEELHIGKSSAGWTFSFEGHPEKGIKSYQDWLKILERETIKDEYGKTVTLEEFRNIVEKRSHPRGLLNHAKEHPEGCWIDDEGHGFSGTEFS